MWRGTIAARRATDLIAAACARAGGRALLPALYCAEVADAIEARGVRCQAYDVPADLGPVDEPLAAALGPGVGAVVINHPFGLARPVDRAALPAELLVVEDACHALRTAQHRPLALGRSGDLIVFSPRKELGWKDGGVAAGPRTRGLPARPAPALLRRFLELDLSREASGGRDLTRLAAEALGDRLPPLRPGEVLTALPLRSARRDELISTLRRRGVLAWRWRRRLRGAGPRSTPMAEALRRELLLVPVSEGDQLQRALHALEGERLLRWKRGTR